MGKIDTLNQPKTCNPERLSEVAGQMQNLEADLSELGNQINLLEDRLCEVLRNEPPKQQAENTTPQTSLVPLASMLRKYSENLAQAALNIADIRSRIEL